MVVVGYATGTHKHTGNVAATGHVQLEHYIKFTGTTLAMANESGKRWLRPLPRVPPFPASAGQNFFCFIFPASRSLSSLSQ